MDSKDYYQTLGVARDATPAEIKKAYRKLVRKYHPDVSKEAQADKRTREINEAYGVLGDAEKRAAYDALGSTAQAGQPFQAPPEWAGSFDFGGGGNDFFSDLFAHVGRRSTGKRSGFSARGQDLRASITIDLHDAYHGATRTITLRPPGHAARALDVTIPRGVLPGQQLRLAGQGYPGVGSAEAGDLLLEIAFKPDARYRVEGRDVLQNIAVAPWEAALGEHIDVATPSGQVKVTVPPGSQSGRKLRLKGRGIPGHPPGDLYLILDVVLPPASSDKAVELYRAMARELKFNPRAAGAR